MKSSIEYRQPASAAYFSIVQQKPPGASSQEVDLTRVRKKSFLEA
jgi:hypothetical protein